MKRRRFLFDRVESSRPEAALRAHSKITSHFDCRCLPPGCVAKTRDIQIFLRFNGLPDRCLNAQNCEFIFSLTRRHPRTGAGDGASPAFAAPAFAHLTATGGCP